MMPTIFLSARVGGLGLVAGERSARTDADGRLDCGDARAMAGSVQRCALWALGRPGVLGVVRARLDAILRWTSSASWPGRRGWALRLARMRHDV